jgi:excisionase family DNA binding protein
MNEILTPAQIAERLQVKRSWVYEQTRERAGIQGPDQFPHIKLGRYLRFDWTDVLQWLERHKIPAKNSAARSRMEIKR